MAESSSVYAALIVGLAVGLVLIVYGEATGGDMLFVSAGGTLGLLCVTVLTLIIARLPEPEHEHGEEH